MIASSFRSSFKRGLSFEALCKSMLSDKGIAVRNSSTHQNMHHHVDFFIYARNWGRWATCDAKAMRALKRGESPQDQLFFVEWCNVAGKSGWLTSGADLIIFERTRDVLIIARTVLLSIANLLTDKTRRASTASTALRSVYQRRGRADLITLLSFKDLPSTHYKLINKPDCSKG